MRRRPRVATAESTAVLRGLDRSPLASPLKLLDVASGAPSLPAGGPAGPLDDAEKFWVLSSDRFAVYDAQRCFVKVNPAWERALGWTSEQLIGQLVFDLIHPDDLQEAIQASQRAVRGSGRAERSESRYRCSDGTYRWFLWSAYTDGCRCSGARPRLTTSASVTAASAT